MLPSHMLTVIQSLQRGGHRHITVFDDMRFMAHDVQALFDSSKVLPDNL